MTTSIGPSVWGRHDDQAYGRKVPRYSVGQATWGKVRNTLGSSYPVTVSDWGGGINVSSRSPAIFVSLPALHLFSSPLLIIFSLSDLVVHSHILLFVHPNIMLNAPLSPSAVDLAFADEDWPNNRTFTYRPASVGNSWGVTSIGRGFDWKPREREAIAEATDDVYDTSQLFFATPSPDPSNSESDRFFFYDPSVIERSANLPSPQMSHPSSPAISRRSSVAKNPAANLSNDALSYPPVFESPISSRPLTPISGRTSPDTSSITLSRRNSRASSSRSRPRRRSSQQRVSLIAGRVSIAQIEPPSTPPTSTRLVRSNSAASFLSVASVGAPTPNSEPSPFLTERSISEFVVEREIGRGAYGLVKRAREMELDGTCGVSLFSNFQLSKADPPGPSPP